VIFRKSILAVLSCGAIALGVAACGSSSDTTSGGGSGGLGGAPGGTINGAGATFPEPVYSEAASQIKGEGLTVNYNAVGSGEGQAQMLAGTVDWAASDPPLEPDFYNKIADKFGTDPVHIPTVFGAVTVSYNLPGVDAGMKLDGPTIADIFLGKITKWNDPALTALNQGVTLPATDIVVAHRSDGSGTTYIWVDYLSKVSPEFKKVVGVATAVKWPVGVAAAKNDGVAAIVKQTPGALGYVELIYALQTKTPYAQVQNASGKFVTASSASVSAAAAAAAKQMPADYRVSITNAPGDAVYPISSFTWMLFYQDPKDKAQAKAMVDFMKWALTDGQKIAAGMDYAPLPPNVIEMEMKTLATIKVQ
jgi:phosphate transport system substrate-binding protein